MSKTDSLHYQLCCEGAKWLKQRKNAEHWQTPWKYICVEMVTIGGENADIWAFNGAATIVVEVKTSHTDFLADKKKWCRSEDNKGKMGNYRYYLAPIGVINIYELPEGWGLMEWNDGKIKRVVTSSVFQSGYGDFFMLGSLLRREHFKEGIYNYRIQPPATKEKWSDSDLSLIDYMIKNYGGRMGMVSIANAFMDIHRKSGYSYYALKEAFCEEYPKRIGDVTATRCQELYMTKDEKKVLPIYNGQYYSHIYKRRRSETNSEQVIY